MAQRAKILWVDLEMTGLSPTEDRILEVAAIATDWDFQAIATFEGIIRYDPTELTTMLDRNKEFWDIHPEARSGLEKQNELGKELHEIEQELIAFCSEYFDEEYRIILGGNSIHQDRRFIDQWWPTLAKRLHYRMLDVSAWKVVFEGKFGKKFAKPESHRALEDIRGSIEELQYYLKKVKS